MVAFGVNPISITTVIPIGLTPNATMGRSTPRPWTHDLRPGVPFGAYPIGRTTVTNVSPEFLGRVTPSAGFAERDRMMPAFREEQRPQSNEQQHGMHRRPQARTCQDPSAKKVLWKAVDWGRQHLIRTPCPPILVDSSARPGEHGGRALTRATRGLEHHPPAGQVDRVARAGRRGRLLLVTLEAARVDADLPVLGGVVAPCIPPVLRWAAD